MTTSGISLADQDRSVRPQDDIFLYANGAWLDRTEIPADRGRYGSFDVLREQAETDCRSIVEDLAARALAAGDGAGDPDERKVADLYRSFMDEERIESLGAAPLAGDLAEIDALTDVAQLPDLLGRWSCDGFGGLVHCYVSTDDRASDRYVTYLEQGGLGLPDESYYREEQFGPIREAYATHVERMLALVGVDDAAGAAARVVALETAIAALHWDRVATRDAVKSYTKWSRADLEREAPAYAWRTWFAAQGADEAVTEVVARQPSFLAAIGELVRDTALDSWQDWLRWQVAHQMAPYLSGDFVRENFDFYGRTLSGLPQLRERWKRGVGLVESALGEALGKAYVAKHFPPTAKERMEELVGNLVEAFRRDFADLEWMSPQTRTEALAKLEAFTPKIGHPNVWRDYSSLEIDPEDLVGNVRRASAFEARRNLAKLGRPVDREEWFMTPQTINAYYNPGMNEIVFPAAILQPPFFDVDADDAVNYGGIGAVIGHEIGHGFDDQGSRYDGAGNLRDWWTPEDRARFEERSNALIAQFDAVESTDAPGNHINGALTVGENIGDLGGLTIGFMAYAISTEGTDAPGGPELDGLTGAQRFFLGWAQVWKGKAREQEAKRLLTIDPHSPIDARARIVRNLDEFHEAFGTVPGDGMWLEESARVRIF